jgi:hypothetical protein
MYATLVERYNPGMNMDEEDRVRLTARKVGMDLPEDFVFAEEEKGKEREWGGESFERYDGGFGDLRWDKIWDGGGEVVLKCYSKWDIMVDDAMGWMFLEEGVMAT